MLIINDYQKKLDSDTAIALGTFDGVHRGHERVIGAAVSAAGCLGYKSAVLTFSSPFRAEALCPLDEKLSFIEALGVDIAIVADIKSGIFALDAHEFLSEILVKNCRAKYISCGFNYTFGKNAKGDAEALALFCRDRGIASNVIPPVTEGGEIISSSAIREQLKNGDYNSARKLLGHGGTFIK